MFADCLTEWQDSRIDCIYFPLAGKGGKFGEAMLGARRNREKYRGMGAGRRFRRCGGIDEACGERTYDGDDDEEEI